MNRTLAEYARKCIVSGLETCTDAQVLIFKRMYSHDNLELPISVVVKYIPDDKLDHALTQVENTVRKNSKI